MHHIVDRLAAVSGVDRGHAEAAAHAFFAVLAREAPPEAVAILFDRISLPDGEAWKDAPSVEAGGTGAMAILNALTGTGLPVDRAQAVARALVELTRERVDAETAASILGRLPGVDALG